MITFPLSDNKKPAVPKGTSWQEYQGPVKTPMIGVMIPDGVFIIDIDLYKGVSTDDVDDALGCQLDWDAAELQKTLKGGMHYAFKVPSNTNLPNDSDLLGVVGFDSRSSGKGYIATGEGYENLTFHDSIIEALQDDLPALPGEAISALMSGVDNEEDELLSLVASEPLELSYDEVSEYVDCLSDEHAADQNTWLKVGMALWHQLGEDGWQLFDTFSQRCPEKYDEDANRRRWESFARKQLSNPRTFASVIELAGGRKEVAIKSSGQKLEQAETLDDIKEQMKKIANVKLDSMELDITLKSLQAKYLEVMGSKPSLPAIKKELRALRDDPRTGEFVDDYVFMTATGEYE